MTTLAKIRKLNLVRIVHLGRLEAFIEKHTPRRCMVVATGLLMAGWSVPVLMALHLLPVTLFFGFLGFILVAAGGGMVLFFCGEI